MDIMEFILHYLTSTGCACITLLAFPKHPVTFVMKQGCCTVIQMLTVQAHTTNYPLHQVLQIVGTPKVKQPQLKIYKLILNNLGNRVNIASYLLLK